MGLFSKLLNNSKLTHTISFILFTFIIVLLYIIYSEPQREGFGFGGIVKAFTRLFRGLRGTRGVVRLGAVRQRNALTQRMSLRRQAMRSGGGPVDEVTLMKAYQRGLPPGRAAYRGPSSSSISLPRPPI